jgi:hypothetical protein
VARIQVCAETERNKPWRPAMMKKSRTCFMMLLFLAVVFFASVSIAAEQEATSMMCDNGIVNIGDYDVDVQDKCGEPSKKEFNVWIYNFGPSEAVYTVIFDQSKVVRILEDEWGG